MAYIEGFNIIKHKKFGTKETFLYKLPEKHYAVAIYNNCELEESQFFFEWIDALHKYNKNKKQEK